MSIIYIIESMVPLTAILLIVPQYRSLLGAL